MDQNAPKLVCRFASSHKVKIHMNMHASLFAGLPGTMIVTRPSSNTDTHICASLFVSLQRAVCYHPVNSYPHNTQASRSAQTSVLLGQVQHSNAHKHASFFTGLLGAVCYRRIEPAGGWKWMNMACLAMPPLTSGLPPLQGPLLALPPPLPPERPLGLLHHPACLTLYLAMLHCSPFQGTLLDCNTLIPLQYTRTQKWYNTTPHYAHHITPPYLIATFQYRVYVG